MRILLVEDDKQLRTAVTRGLREAGYTVDQAANGSQAEATAARGTYDAIVLDVLLPGQDGVAVCRALRAAGNDVPILMLTALDAVEYRIKGLDAGADDYLTKPFDFGELLARLRALTRRHGDKPLGDVQVGDLVIDTRAMSVRRGGRSIELTGKEFAFLLYLARHAGRVVPRAELMSQVWDDAQSYTNVIDVYASRLRRKIDEGERVSLFTTLRGVGYMISVPDESATRTRAGASASRRRG
jgi:two-component system copper resistance phosphate regulon response regulator CusR